MNKLFQLAFAVVLLFGILYRTQAQSILSIALTVETGIKEHAPQWDLTEVRVYSQKSEQGTVMLHLACEGQRVWLTVMEHESAPQARDFLRKGLATVDPALYQVIELPDIGEEGYTFANWDGSNPQLGTLYFRLGKVTFGITECSDETARKLAKSVSNFMRAT